MKKIILMVTLMSFGWTGFSQDFIDNALLFSRTRPGGSARIQALGGTQTSLGGDYSSAFSNPAGLGMFNHSEFTISPGYTSTTTSSDYRNQNTLDSKTNLTLPGLSLVYHHKTQRDNGFIGGSFAVSMTRLNDFNRNFTYRGENSDNSIIDYFINDADGLDPQSMLWNGNTPGDNFFTLTGLAYNNYLIEDYVKQNGDYGYRSVLSPLPAEPGFPAEVRTVDQQEVSKAKGGQTQWSFSYGANFSDRFFIGAGVGISSLKYKVKQYFTESNFRFSEDPDYVPIDNFQTEEEYTITGSGVNLTIGAIGRPVDFLQIGVSYATPTYYNIIDNYSARIDSHWNTYNVPNSTSYPDQPDVYETFDQPLTSEYNLSTPGRLSGGITFISKIGLLSFDVDRVNYSRAKYDSNIDDNFDAENNGIKAQYERVYNFRTGGEYRINKWRVRAGFNYMADPYRDSEVDQSISTYSAGFGYRDKNFFIDLAVMYSKTMRSRSPYYVNGPDPIAYQKYTSTPTMITLGFIL